MLAQHRVEQDAERAAWGAGWTDTGLVFVREDGRPLKPSVVSRRFQMLCRKAGVPVIRFHDPAAHVGDAGPAGRRVDQGDQ